MYRPIAGYKSDGSLFRKRDERLKRVVEARVKGEKEKEQEKKKKIEEKMAQIEKKNDMVGCSPSLKVFYAHF